MTKAATTRQHRLARAGSSSLAPSPTLTDSLNRGAPEVLTPVERYQAACAALAHVERELKDARDGCESCKPRLHALRVEKHRLDRACREAKDAAGLHRTTPASLQDSFMDVAREILTVAQFKLVYELAHKRAREAA